LGQPNSTQSAANLQVFQLSRSAPVATYTLVNTQQRPIGETESVCPSTSLTIVLAVAVVVSALLLSDRAELDGNTSPQT
jgi:hypothetical protein